MIRCIAVRLYEKNTLRAFVDLELSRVGLILHDCTWHKHANGKEWISFPARKFDGPNGPSWQAVIEFAQDAKQARERFQSAALQAVHEAAEHAA